MATRGFFGKRPTEIEAGRLPPGQYLTEDFPVLSAGPTPRVDLDKWSFTLKDGVRPVAKWTWDEFQKLPHVKLTRDIHCVTKWSKFNTAWSGVMIDDILAEARHRGADGLHAGAFVRRLHDERADRRSRRRQGDDRHGV